MIKAVLFDLDGTLLPMDEAIFTKEYFARLCAKLAPYGYKPDALTAAVWAGTKAMIKNCGEENNDVVFWKTFAETLSPDVLKHRPVFDDFYFNEFNTLKSVCGFDPDAAATVKKIKDAGYMTAVATNPIFPLFAMQSRIKWAGIDPDSFALITAYENINRSKPNPGYYKEIARRLCVSPDECLMVGNNVKEDISAASAAGMSVFLMTACLICTPEEALPDCQKGGFKELADMISGLSQNEKEKIK